LQVDTPTGYIKILPRAYINAAVIATDGIDNGDINTWIRYTSGFEIVRDTIDGGFTTNDVPSDVQIATTMYVNYLYQLDSLSGTVGGFSTQTYSQKNVAGEQSPLVQGAKELLKPYKSYIALGSQ
jgi:hypothetical protein